MSLFNFFSRPKTSAVARDRLQILLAHERSNYGNSELIKKLQSEILEVIKKHVAIDDEKVHVKMDSVSGECATLEIDIEMPGLEKAS